MGAKVESVDDYLASLSDERLAMAKALRRLIRKAVPKASEAIKYGMPTFQIAGTSFLYFGIWRRHAGVYPVSHGDAAFEARVGPYRAAKDTVQFKFGDKLPETLVTAIARAQAARVRG